MTPQDELADCQEMLTARENRPGYAANVAAIKARIAELQAIIGGN